MNRSVFKKHFGQAADETAQSSSLCTSEPYRQGNPKQSSPRSPGQSASLPFHTHCSSFWNLETIQLCVTKAGRWSLQRGTQPEGRHSVLQSSLYKADGAHQGKNPHGRPLPASWSRLWLQMIKELTMAVCSNHQQMYRHHCTDGCPTG